MPFVQGGEWCVELEDPATPDSYAPVGGETSFDWSSQSKELNFSSKDDGAYAAIGYGSKTVSIRCAGKVKLPDVGLERAYAASKNPAPTIKARIVDVATQAVKYQGLMALGNFSGSWPNDEPATYNFDLKTAAAPTVDDLGATA